MLSIDFLISFTLMAVLFLRQVYILKQPNKINYAPLMLSIGFIATLLHFITHPEITDTTALVRESLYPMLVSLILFLIMNILHQTQVSESAKMQEQFIKVLVGELSQLKEFILELEKRMNDAQLEDKNAREQIIQKFQNDLASLEVIQNNQMKFADMFEEVRHSLKDVQQGYRYFSDVQLPELDEVVHKHIDILRVAEQDHYNKLSTLLEQGVKGREEIAKEIEQMKQSVSQIKGVSREIATTIVQHTLEQIGKVVRSFEEQLNLLRSQTEGMRTSLSEEENLLGGIRTQSELLLKQMTLMAQSMADLQSQKGEYDTFFLEMKSMVDEIEKIKSDYVKAQSQLSQISHELLETKDQKVLEMKHNLDELSATLSKKIDESLEKLHEHYHITHKDISQSVQTLAQKAQLLKGYEELS